MLGFGSLTLFFEDMVFRLSNLRPVLDGPIRNSIHQFYKRQFDSEGAVGGEPWQGLSPATLAIKSRLGRAGMGTMQRSRRLWASLTKRGGPEQFVRLTDDSIEVGTQVQNAGFPYAVAMQEGWTQRSVFGKPRKRAKKIRPRKIVPDELPTSLTNAWGSLIADHVVP